MQNKIHCPRASTKGRHALCDAGITADHWLDYYMAKKDQRCQACESILRKIDGVEFERRVKRFGGEI